MANSLTRQLPFPVPLLSAKDILARLGNQADRPPLRSPPIVTPARLADSLSNKSGTPAVGAMRAAAVQKITRLEIHGIYDDSKPVLNQTVADGTPLALVVPFNPATLEHTIKANWAELTVPGLSYKRLHYFGTENQTLKFDLFLDYMVELQRVGSGSGSTFFPARQVADVSNAYRFLQSLLYPKSGTEGPSNLHPPEVLLFWPNALSLHCVLWEMAAKWEKMLPTGELASATVSLTFKEIPKQRITLEAVRTKGTLRTPPAPAATAPDFSGSSSNIG